MGVVAALLKWMSQGFTLPYFQWHVKADLGVDLLRNGEGTSSELFALALYLALAAYMFFDAKRAKVEQ